jgi:hypothetical protein
MIDDGVRRYFVPSKTTTVEPRDNLSGVPQFTLSRQNRSRLPTPEVIGTSVASPFDEFGRRDVSLTLPGGKTISVIEQITLLRPDYLKVEGINYDWEHGLDPRVLPPDRLNQLLHSASRKNNLDDHKAIVRFYIDSQRYQEASVELRRLAEAFPDQADWVDSQLPILAEQNIRSGMLEVQRLRAAGQHGFALTIARAALNEPANSLSVDVLREVQEIVSAHEAARETRDRALLLLEEYESKLEPEDAKRVKPMRAAVRDELNAYENMERLDPFLRSEDDDTLTPAQKLALAYSGWALGSSFAEVELNTAISLWQARFIVLEYIRINDDPYRRGQRLEQLSALEGITVERLEKMVPLLPYVLEENPPAAGEIRDYTVPTSGAEPAVYSVSLPLQYQSQHRYPLLVVLRRHGQTPADALKWWSGDTEAPGYAMRRGYIVISPEFAAADAHDYAYDVTAHQKVMAAITDARKRFSVDSDRIFIAGHEMGGDACFDIALAHPDVFAGAAPFLAQPDRYVKVAVQNGTLLSWYVVGGEKDRDTIDRNAVILDSLVHRTADLLGYGTDVVYCEYKARGFESYYEELPRLFDWMESHRRITQTRVKADRDGFKVFVLRPTDDRYFWVESQGMPQKLMEPILWDKVKTIPRMPASAKYSGSSLYVSDPYTSTRIWMSPELFDFDNRIEIHVAGSKTFRELVQPSAEALLEDFRIRGDRERLYWAYADFK